LGAGGPQFESEYPDRKVSSQQSAVMLTVFF
jgi:hypothetical protein